MMWNAALQRPYVTLLMIEEKKTQIQRCRQFKSWYTKDNRNSMCISWGGPTAKKMVLPGNETWKKHQSIATSLYHSSGQVL